MFIPVPFKMDGGLTEINGLAKFSPAGIVLEFEEKFLGFIKSGFKENRITIGEVLDVRFRKGFLKLGVAVEIRLNSFKQVAELPNESGTIKLKIKRTDFDSAREACELINRALAEHRAALPPAHTPVSVLFDESEAETEELSK